MLRHTPVVYVHGLIGHLRCSVLRHGMEVGSVMQPDLLGYGVHRKVSATSLTLEAQVRHLRAKVLTSLGDRRAMLVAHSGGAAVAVRYAHRYPEAIAGVICVEGNLAASDAYLSSRFAAQDSAAVQCWLDGVWANPGAWLTQQRAQPTSANVRRVRDWLDNQSAAAIHVMSRILVMETAVARYAADVREVMRRVPVHLVMGALSQRASELPTDLRGLAASLTTLPGVGHLLPLTHPAMLAQEVATRAGHGRPVRGSTEMP